MANSGIAITNTPNPKRASVGRRHQASLRAGDVALQRLLHRVDGVQLAGLVLRDQAVAHHLVARAHREEDRFGILAVVVERPHPLVQRAQIGEVLLPASAPAHRRRSDRPGRRRSRGGRRCRRCHRAPPSCGRTRRRTGRRCRVRSGPGSRRSGPAASGCGPTTALRRSRNRGLWARWSASLPAAKRKRVHPKTTDDQHGRADEPEVQDAVRPPAHEDLHDHQQSQHGDARDQHDAQREGGRPGRVVVVELLGRVAVQARSWRAGSCRASGPRPSAGTSCPPSCPAGCSPGSARPIPLYAGRFSEIVRIARRELGDASAASERIAR